MKHLSTKQKSEYLNLLIKRDGGFKCLYCKKQLKIDSFIYEHLNNDREDNRIENLVLACQSCNVKKANDYDMQIIAQEKLKNNEDRNFVGERKYEDVSSREVSTEIDINVTNFDITKQFLLERIHTDGSIEYTDVLNSIAYLCKEKTGHGSQQSIRNYIATLASSVGPFMIIKNENKKRLIVKRSGN